MSRITRIPTKQGHPVPSRVMPTQGPFPRDLYSHPPVVTEYEKISGNGGPEIPFGSTAQNNFKPLKWFRCKLCAETIKESDLSSHRCPDKSQSYLPDYSNSEYYDDDDYEYDDDDYEDEEDDYEDGRVHQL